MTTTEPVTSTQTTNLTEIPTDDLRAQLAEAIGMTAHAIQRVALIWRELTVRGEDLSNLRFALRDYMLDVADGRILPETVASLAGEVRKLRLVGSLPVEDQRRLVIDGATVPVVTAGAVVERSLDQMTFSEASRVIRGGTLRSPEEQQIAARRRPVTGRAARVGRPVKLVVNKGTGMIDVAGKQVAVEDMLAALRANGYLE